jgi:hypothetical protein
MTVNPDFISPCGLYCGVCAIHIAHRSNNEKFKQRLVNLYKGGVAGKGTLPNSGDLSTQDMQCTGPGLAFKGHGPSMFQGLAAENEKGRSQRPPRVIQ